MIRDRLTKERAETIALDGLTFLAGNGEELERFLRNSGLDSAELRLRAADPDVLRAVVEHLLTNDELLMDFCRERELDPRDLHLANHVLGGP